MEYNIPYVKKNSQLYDIQKNLIIGLYRKLR